MVRLTDLVSALGGSAHGPTGSATLDPELAGVHLDSRLVERGSLFCALPGAVHDGLDHARAALERGAVALLAPDASRERALRFAAEVPVWLHDEARRATGEGAALVYGRPSRDLLTFAVTGTNGKTTVAHVIAHLLRAAGRDPGVVGTVGNQVSGAAPLAAHNTTPDATALQRLCRAHRDAGGDCLVTEASSHALDQHRLAGFEVDIAVFTNLTRDHLDYHGSMEAYADAKAKLFESLREGGHAILPAGDPSCEAVVQRFADIARERGAQVHTYSIGSRADLSATRWDVVPMGINSFLDGMGISWESLVLPLIGVHNLANALAALAAVLVSGASPSALRSGLATVSCVTGRLEPVHAAGAEFGVFVDFAHTPDALRAALSALRGQVEASGSAGRVICVFGCGGEKDQGKRPLMGRVASELSDLVVLTSDNPRSEDPLAIIEQARAGIPNGTQVVVEPDRRAAIEHALGAARAGDLVLLAGKGHEDTQELGDRVIPFSDREVAREVLS